MTTLYSATRRAPTQGLAPSVAAIQQQAATCETVQEIIDVAVTAEAFAVTFLGVLLDAAAAGTVVLEPDAVGSFVAARAAEQAHYDVLIASGAQPLTTTFTIPDDILSDPATLFETIVSLEEAFIAAYLTAAQTFVTLGEPTLAQLALQIGAVEAEHRVGVRFFGINAGAIDDPVPNDVAFEKALFERVSEAADLLTELGFIDGDGSAVEFPGPGVIDATGVRNLVPPTPGA